MQIIFEKLSMEHQKPIMEVFNYYIENSTAAFPTSVLPEEFYKKFMEMTKGYPAYAIVDPGTHEVLGFCMLRAYSPFSSFNETAEISYFISKDYVGKGIGEQCLERLESEAKQMETGISLQRSLQKTSRVWDSTISMAFGPVVR
jgi:L-amino acid N-acyltransferase YncA